jgi:hypothetical protein
MRPYVKNVILASADQVAIDAVAARLMGFDPLRDLKFVRLAHERGLGCGDPRAIELVGDTDAANENWRFVGPFQKMTFASRMQHRIYWGGLKKPMEWSLKTVLAPWAYIASVLYHDSFWYPTHQQVLREILNSEWGRLFHNWEQVAIPPDRLEAEGWKDVGPPVGEFKTETAKLLLTSLRILGTCIREAPEFDARRRRRAAAGRSDQ